MKKYYIGDSNSPHFETLEAAQAEADKNVMKNKMEIRDGRGVLIAKRHCYSILPNIAPPEGSLECGNNNYYGAWTTRESSANEICKDIESLGRAGLYLLNFCDKLEQFFEEHEQYEKEKFYGEDTFM